MIPPTYTKKPEPRTKNLAAGASHKFPPRPAKLNTSHNAGVKHVLRDFTTRNAGTSVKDSEQDERTTVSDHDFPSAFGSGAPGTGTGVLAM